MNRIKLIVYLFLTGIMLHCCPVYGNTTIGNIQDEVSYVNWRSGMKKNVALDEAKSYIRSFEKWNDPRYWASFVLLDWTE